MPLMLRMKDTNKLFRNILRALPAIPLVRPKRKASILPLVFGAIGVAIAGGIAAVMVFSPRTRYRALDMAKGGYGKVRGQLDQRGWSEKLGMHKRTTPGGYQNGLVSESSGSSYESTGL